MKKLLLVPALLLAACTDPAHDTLDGTVEEEAPAPGPGTPATPETSFYAGFFMEPHSCTDNSVRLVAYWSYADGTRPDNVLCRYELSDGTVVGDSCLATPSFPTAQQVTLTVTDPATGAVATHSELAKGPESFSTTADVTSDGLSISWDAHTAYGSSIDVAGVSVSISPAEKVIVSAPSVLNQFAGTVTVTEAGTYTVTVNGGISFGEVGGCGASVETIIEVTCDGTMHDH